MSLSISENRAHALHWARSFLGRFLVRLQRNNIWQQTDSVMQHSPSEILGEQPVFSAGPSRNTELAAILLRMTASFSHLSLVFVSPFFVISAPNGHYRLFILSIIEYQNFWLVLWYFEAPYKLTSIFLRLRFSICCVLQRSSFVCVCCSMKDAAHNWPPVSLIRRVGQQADYPQRLSDLVIAWPTIRDWLASRCTFQ